MDLTPDRALAVALLADNRTSIAQAIVRLARRLEPRWGNVPGSVAEKSAENQLKAVERFLKTDDPTAILELVADLVRLRRHTGFGVGDFAVKSHAYLPVLRKVFMRSKHPLEESLRAYDVVESAMLPLVARILQEALAEAPRGRDEREHDRERGARGRAPFEAATACWLRIVPWRWRTRGTRGTRGRSGEDVHEPAFTRIVRFMSASALSVASRKRA